MENDSAKDFPTRADYEKHQQDVFEKYDNPEEYFMDTNRKGKINF